MRRTMVAGNWKMNASSVGTQELMTGIIDGVEADAGCDVLVCPPYPYLQQVRDHLRSTESTHRVRLGGQDLDVNESGAFTGAVSASMLKDCGCEYVLVGHSERRSLYGESDELTAAKARAASHHGLIAVVCVGETLEQREQNATEEVLQRQLAAVLEATGAQVFSTALIAYEPVWAIGTGKTATPAQAQDAHAFIRELIRKHSDAVADTVRILYGGSVKGDNAAGLFSQPDIDGGLIGGASLKATDFLDIVRTSRSGS